MGKEKNPENPKERKRSRDLGKKDKYFGCGDLTNAENT